MKILGTLFFAVAVFLNSIELVSSVDPVERSLAQLFPGYEPNGYLPIIRIFLNRNITSSTEFGRIGNHILRRPRHAPLLSRGHVIFAWQGDNRNFVNDRMGDYVEPLWQLFQPLGHEQRWVFDSTHNHWVTLNEIEFKKLGFGYRMTLVMTQHDTAIRHTLQNIDARAHQHAYLKANHRVDLIQAREAQKIERELVSSVDPVERSLAQLFPGYEENGYLPTICIALSHNTTSSSEFRRIGNQILRRPRHALFLERGSVIFAWQGDNRNIVNDRMGDYIEPLWQLFQPLGHEQRWVFDRRHNHWATMNEDEFRKLGFGYRMILVKTQYDTAARHTLIDTNARAHFHAYWKANHEVDLLQANEARKLDRAETTIDESIAFIRRSYEDAYDTAFYEFTDQYG